MGQWDESQAAFEPAIEIATRMGDQRWLGNSRVEQYLLLVEEGDVAGADAIAAWLMAPEQANAPIDEDLIAMVTAIQGAEGGDRPAVEAVFGRSRRPAPVTTSMPPPTTG